VTSLALDKAMTAGDSVLLASLVQNLVDNAVAHNIPGGTVWVETFETDGRAVLEVANDGPAVAPEQVAGLFEPFRRLRRVAEPDGGVGLGLAIARAVALAHGGDVVAHARPSGGLQVRAELPAAGATADHASGADAEPALAASDRTSS
jgi:signal transduction histidine kinase